MSLQDAGYQVSWNFYKHFGYSGGISLTIPVYDGKAKSSCGNRNLNSTKTAERVTRQFP